jgi:hypothetical protein
MLICHLLKVMGDLQYFKQPQPTTAYGILPSHPPSEILSHPVWWLAENSSPGCLTT